MRLFLILLFGIPCGLHAITVSDEVSPERFETTPGVLAFGVNIDGVVSIDTVIPGSGALISDTHILTSAHVLYPNISFFGTWFTEVQVRFELPGGSVVIPVVGISIHPSYRIDLATNDIAVLELASPAPAGVPRYPLYQDSDEVGKNLVAVGFGATGHGLTGASITDRTMRAGPNRIDGTGDMPGPLLPGFNASQLIWDFDSGASENDVTAFFAAPDLGLGIDEIGLGGGDSGGPLFLPDSAGQFRIAGVNVAVGGFIGTPNPSVDPIDITSWGNIMISERVSAQLDYINGALGGDLIRIRQWNDGMTHLESGAMGAVYVHQLRDSADSAPTHLRLEPGSMTDGLNWAAAVELGDTSSVDLAGGHVQGSPGIAVSGQGRLDISAGTIVGLAHSLESRAGANNAINVSDDSEVSISGGLLTGAISAVSATGQARVAVTGGSFEGEEADLLAAGSSIIRIHGHGFNHALGPVPGSAGTITGSYRDGTPFEITYEKSENGMIELVPDHRSPGQLSLTRVSRFPTTNVGNRSRFQRITIENTGDESVDDIRIRMRGKGRKQFTATRAAQDSLAPGARTSFRARFKPRQIGRWKATVTVRSTGADVSTPLRARAVAPAQNGHNRSSKLEALSF